MEVDRKPLFPGRKDVEARMSDTVADEIIYGLYAGQFAPGQRLIEEDLSRLYKVSRIPIREALKRLASEGVIELTRRRGAYIRTLSRKQLQDVIQVTATLYGLLVRLATERADEDGRRRLQACYEDMLQYREDSDFLTFVRVTNAYNATLRDVAANDELTRLMPMVHVHHVRILLRKFPSVADLRFSLYTDVHASIMSGDANAAEGVARSGIHRLLDRIAELPDEAFPSGPTRRAN